MNDPQLVIDFHVPATTPPADDFVRRKARYVEACALYDWALEQALAALDQLDNFEGFIPALFDDFMRTLEVFKSSAWREFHGQPTHHFTIEPDLPRRDGHGRCVFTLKWIDDGRPHCQVFNASPEEHAERLRRKRCPSDAQPTEITHDARFFLQSVKARRRLQGVSAEHEALTRKGARP